jgi:hypothetical protein
MTAVPSPPPVTIKRRINRHRLSCSPYLASTLANTPEHSFLLPRALLASKVMSGDTAWVAEDVCVKTTPASIPGIFDVAITFCDLQQFEVLGLAWHEVRGFPLGYLYALPASRMREWMCRTEIVILSIGTHRLHDLPDKHDAMKCSVPYIPDALNIAAVDGHERKNRSLKSCGTITMRHWLLRSFWDSEYDRPEFKWVRNPKIVAIKAATVLNKCQKQQRRLRSAMIG